MEEEVTLREKLAKERTHFANERTLLAYGRTALAFFALGAFLIKFIPQKHFVAIGIVLVIFGLGLFFYGLKKFLYWKNKINKE